MPVDGQWGEWQPWTHCSTSCGEGMQTRQRICNNPPPAMGGRICPPENGRQNQECLIVQCPVDGRWSQWGEFSPCTASCGRGIRTRKRDCNSPAPNFGGNPCFGESLSSIECYLGPCPIDGGWSMWSPWSECSATCGGGIQERFRICDNPPPQFNGKECEDRKEDIKECRADIECPVHGHWSAWSDWGECFSPDCILNKTQGFQYRYRACDNPSPQHNGLMCQETFIDAGICFDPKNCPSDGQWGKWSEWECIGSEMQRIRKCDNPAPRYGGKPCREEDAVEEISREDDPESFEVICGKIEAVENNPDKNAIGGEGNGDEDEYEYNYDDY